MGFLKAKKSRPAHVGRSNYFAKQGGVKKGRGVDPEKDLPPIPCKLVFVVPLFEKVIRPRVVRAE
jgi:hypothetical protein